MFEKELEQMIIASLKAKEVIMEIYKKHSEVVEIKEDKSPVTQADKQSDTLIRTYLHNMFPEYGLLSEETSDDKSRLEKDYVFIIDPIDGTKDFIDHDDEFAINIALSYKHEIVAGVICVPAMDELYYASKGKGAFMVKDGETKQIHTSDNEVKRVVRSRFHTLPIEDKYIEERKDLISDIIGCGSSYKGCKIARGDADLNFKLGAGTKEWDTAPMDIIVKEAGGSFTHPDGSIYTYNREDVYNRDGFVILNKVDKKFFTD